MSTMPIIFTILLFFGCIWTKQTEQKQQEGTIMKPTSIIVSVCAVLMLSSMVVLAKRETIGIYAIVDKVAFEPDEKSPERIRIWGVFVVPVPMSSGHYKAPKRGFLYFSIAPGMEQVVKQEWGDLKALAGTGQGIG